MTSTRAQTNGTTAERFDGTGGGITPTTRGGGAMNPKTKALVYAAVHRCGSPVRQGFTAAIIIKIDVRTAPRTHAPHAPRGAAGRRRGLEHGLGHASLEVLGSESDGDSDHDGGGDEDGGARTENKPQP